MPPRKSRDVKSAAPSPSPARSLRARSTAASDAERAEPSVPSVMEEDETADDETGDDEADGAGGPAEDGGSEDKGKMSREERMAKLKELRMRMNESTAANRRDLVSDHQKSKVTARELARLEKQKKLAQTLRLKTEAEANGEDMERKKAWEWSIEQNERWEKKMQEQAERGDTHYHNANDDAYRKYAKNVRTTKPDLVGYGRQKEAAMGLEPGTIVPLHATNDKLAAAGPSNSSGLSAAEDLYRTADTLSYGDSKPSEDAIDRVMQKINNDMGRKTGKKRQKEDDESADVTYINKANKHFNKKIARYFDKYTKEIRENLERGTAL